MDNSARKDFLHHTTKYDGSLHYRFPVEIVSADEDTLIVYRGPDEEIHSYRGSFPTETHALLLYYRNHYHNIFIAWNRDWTPLMHYVNIATPASWNGEKVTAVDMDLDLIRRSGEDEVIIDDENEFSTHKDLFGYPQNLITSCREELDRLYSAMTARKGIYDDRIFSWRPGDMVDAELALPL